ncbi:MAG: hypothetical protein ACYTKD_22880 [Planctomycetota bacterium]
MRSAFAWTVMVAGMAACGMFLGSLSRGGSSVPMVTLGILGAGVAVAGGRAVARERRRAARAAAASDERRHGVGRRLKGALAVLLLFAAALAGACLVRKFL